MERVGDNFVRLEGTIRTHSIKTVGDNNISLFKGKFAMPINGKVQYINIASWGDTAESLSEAANNHFIRIHGHIEESSYNGKCRHCGGPEKKYWTEVLVDNFIIID